MASLTLRPGAFTREIDLSFISPSIANENIYSFAGFTNKGKAFVPTRITQYLDFSNQFGGMNENFMIPYAVKEVTRNEQTCLVTRVLGTDSTLALNSYFPLIFSTTGQTVTGATTISSLSGKILGILRFRDTVSGTPVIGMTGTATSFTISITGIALTGSDSGYTDYATGSVTGLSIDSTSPNYIGKKLGTNPVSPKSGNLLTSVYVERLFSWYASAGAAEETYFDDATYAGALTATTTLTSVSGNVITSSTDLTFGEFKEAVTPWIMSQNYNGLVLQLMKFHTFSDGTSANGDVKISISDVTAGTATKPVSFTVSVRRYNDTDGRGVILEQFKNCNFDPDSKNYIGKLIGDTYEVVDLTTGDITKVGTYPAQSQYVYVELADNIPSDAVPSGFQSIEYLYPAAGKDSVQLPYKINQLSNAAYSSSVFMGADLDTFGVKLLNNILAPLPDGAAAKQQQKGFLILGSGETSASATLTSYVMVTLSSTGNARDKQFTVPFYDGWDGIDPTVAVSAQQTSLSGAFVTAINMLSDSLNYDFDIFAIPDCQVSAVQTLGETMCRERSDAYMVMDFGAKDTGKLTITGSSYFGGIDSSYAGGNYPWLKYRDTENEVDVWVPASLGAVAAMSYTDKVAYPWFAAAGLTRGVVNFSDVYYPLKASDLVVYSNEQVNPFRMIAGNVVRFGQKTLQRASSALQDENVRRLLIKSRKIVLAIAQKYSFEPNEPRTWDRFTEEVNPILEDIQTKRGLNLFKVEMNIDTNPNFADTNQMYGKIAIQPTRAAEVVLIDFFILNGSVTIDEI